MTKASDNYALLVTLLRASVAVNDAIAHAADQALSGRRQEFEKLLATLATAELDMASIRKKLKDGWRR